MLYKYILDCNVNFEFWIIVINWVVLVDRWWYKNYCIFCDELGLIISKFWKKNKN